VTNSSKIALRLPDGWKSASTTTGGLRLRAAVAAGPARSGRPELLAGLAGYAHGSSLVRAAEAHGGSPAKVRLGPLEAWERDHARIGGAPARLYVGYTTSGPLIAICRSAPGRAFARCRDTLETLTLSGARPIPLASIEQLRQRFGSAIRTLRRTWIDRRAALAAAPIASDQAREARALELTFAEASGEIGGMRVPPGVTDLAPVVAALDHASEGYRALANAIRVADMDGYDEARADILKGEAQLEKAVARAAIP
jgi:hypothetical protein